MNMGLVETKATNKRRRRDMRRAMIMTIGVAGIIAAAAVAPNMFQILGRSGALNKLKYQSKSILARLKIKGEIEFVERDGKQYVQLTNRGEEFLMIERQKMLLAKPRKWDRRYRLVMFDVPEKRKKIRDQLRHQMQEVGFLRIQNSAWVYPYDCEEFIALLKADLHIGKDVLYAVVEEIENDAQIRKHFRLSFK
jgi:CRISPR/Cas system-associated endoribonuclease Cas2